MELAEYRVDVLELKGNVNKFILEGESYYASYANSNKEEEQNEIKSKMEDLLNGKAKEFVNITDVYLSKTGKFNETINAFAYKMKKTAETINEFKLKINATNEDTEIYLYAIEEKAFLTKTYEENLKTIFEIQKDNIDCKNELLRGEMYLADLITKFAKLLLAKHRRE